MIVEGLKAAAVASVGVAGFHWGAQTYWPAYRGTNYRLKAFWLPQLIVAAFWISAEKAHLHKITLDRGEGGV